MITTSPRRSAFAVIVAGAVLALVGLSGCGAGAALQQDVDGPESTGSEFAAFGDSYSAGEGTNDYLPGTAEPGVNVCHRSPLAYSQLLVGTLDPASNAFAACSGAVTADLFLPNNNKNELPDGQLEPAQLCQTDPVAGIEPCGSTRPPALGPDTKIVTLTIGGNDAGFAKVVETCLFGDAGRYHVGLPGRGCRFDTRTVDATAKRIAALAGKGQDTSPYGSQIHSIASVLAAIHTAAPDAQVYIAGYPQIFQPSSAADCVVGSATEGTTTIPLAVTADDARALDGAARVLDGTIRAAAEAAGPWATYVAPSTFQGHGLCTDSSWLNAVQADITFGSAGDATAIASDPGSLHPTPRGQQDGYEAAFLAAGVGVTR